MWPVGLRTSPFAMVSAAVQTTYHNGALHVDGSSMLVKWEEFNMVRDKVQAEETAQPGPSRQRCI